MKSAMTERLCEYSEGDRDHRGKPTKEYLELYSVWGRGEIGIIVLGNIPIDRSSLEAKKNAVIDLSSPWDPVEAFKPAIYAAKKNGSLVLGQLTHGGRQTNIQINPHPLSSSDVQNPPAFGMTFARPRAMSVIEIDNVVQRFASGAEVLYKAGADGVQLHAAHGYLFSQFLSARVNKRTDSYGGPLENRARIIFRTIEAIKRVVPKSFMLSVKLNSADFSDGGFAGDEATILSKQLETAGVELIELSGGDYETDAFVHKTEHTKKREAYFLEFADQIRPTLESAVLAVTGGFRSVGPMAKAIREESCQMIGIGRCLCAEPYLVRDLLAGIKAAAKENKVDPVNQIGAAIAQISAIGSRLPIPDLSLPPHA